MNQTLRFLGGMALGAGAMYILDPNRGRSRRALLRDRGYHLLRKAGHDARLASQDLQHRAHGLVAETRSKLIHPDVSDEILIDRVRSRVGHIISFPKSIEIQSQQGNITVKGQVLSDEMDRLLREVSHVVGVKNVINELSLFEDSHNNPALQGRKSSRNQRKYSSPVFREVNSPGIRLLLGTLAGGAFSFLAFGKRNAA